MRKGIRAIGVCCVLALTMSNLAVTAAGAPATTERYLHVKVDDASKGESVNVNVPLSMAQAILPTINKGTLAQRPRNHRRIRLQRRGRSHNTGRHPHRS